MVQGNRTSLEEEQINDADLKLIDTLLQKIEPLPDMCEYGFVVVKILKQLKFHKYIEYTPYIIRKLRPFVHSAIYPYFNDAKVDALCAIHKEVYVLHRKLFPRKSLLSHMYLLRRYLEMLGDFDLMNCIPKFSSRCKEEYMDQVWEEIKTHLEPLPEVQVLMV
jgi:hypothetical protein